MIVTAPTLTNAGKGLLLRGIAGETITFTRFKIGSGRLGSRVIEEMTDLVTVKKAFNITKMDSSEAGVLKLQGRFDSTEIDTAFVWRELGIFAHGEDGTELLYAYANDGDSAQTLPMVSSDVAVTQIVTMAISIGEAQNVTAQFDPDPEYASSADLLALQAATVGTEWTELTKGSGISDGSSSMGQLQGIYYRVEDGHHVYVHANVALSFTYNDQTHTALTAVGAIPEALRPASGRIHAVGFADFNYTQLKAYVDSSGTLRLQSMWNENGAVTSQSITWTDIMLDWFI